MEVFIILAKEDWGSVELLRYPLNLSVYKFRQFTSNRMEERIYQKNRRIINSRKAYQMEVVEQTSDNRFTNRR